jgi:hypothetical protein
MNLAFLFLFVGCLSAATAQAQQPIKAADSSPLPPALAQDAVPAIDARIVAKADDAKPPLSEANCVRKTGSRIRQRDAKTACTGQPGRSYSKDELDRTGHTNLGDALRALDPAVR